MSSSRYYRPYTSDSFDISGWFTLLGVVFTVVKTVTNQPH